MQAHDQGGIKTRWNVNGLVRLLTKKLKNTPLGLKVRRSQQMSTDVNSYQQLSKVLQIHYWVQKVRRGQQLLKVFFCSIIGTPEQQLWCHWCQGRAQDKGNWNSFLATFSLFKLDHLHQYPWGQRVSLYQKLLKVLPANFCGPNHNIHSQVNWRQKLLKVFLGSSISITGTAEQQLWCHWCQGRAQDKGNRNSFLATFSYWKSYLLISLDPTTVFIQRWTGDKSYGKYMSGTTSE